MKRHQGGRVEGGRGGLYRTSLGEEGAEALVGLLGLALLGEVAIGLWRPPVSQRRREKEAGFPLRAWA